MGYRLSKITTRTGDKGTTGLGDGSRVDKNSCRIQAIGDVDELNSLVGLLRCEALPPTIDAELEQLQHDLFDLGGELCIPTMQIIQIEYVAKLEEFSAAHNAKLTPLKDFILPGGTKAAATAHVARAVCRRAERQMVALHASEPLSAVTLSYINRVSDYLFILARRLNVEAGRTDVLWKKQR